MKITRRPEPIYYITLYNTTCININDCVVIINYRGKKTILNMNFVF
jgi:hypothetical protein